MRIMNGGRGGIDDWGRSGELCETMRKGKMNMREVGTHFLQH